MATTDEPNRLEIGWSRVVGSALGAVTAAVVLSSLGAAGTLIGAALGSLCITVGGAVYARSLERTREAVVDVKVYAAQRRTRPHSSRPEAARRRDAPTLVNESGNGGRAQRTASWVQVLRNLPWRRITATAMAVFGVAMAMILVFELLSGRAVSSYTGGSSGASSGTSIPGFDGRGGEPGETDTNEQQEQEQDGAEQDNQAPEQAPEEEQAPVPSEEESVGPDPGSEAPVEPQQEADQ